MFDIYKSIEGNIGEGNFDWNIEGETPLAIDILNMITEINEIFKDNLKALTLLDYL